MTRPERISSAALHASHLQYIRLSQRVRPPNSKEHLCQKATSKSSPYTSLNRGHMGDLKDQSLVKTRVRDCAQKYYIAAQCFVLLDSGRGQTAPSMADFRWTRRRDGHPSPSPSATSRFGFKLLHAKVSRIEGTSTSCQNLCAQLFWFSFSPVAARSLQPRMCALTQSPPLSWPQTAVARAFFGH